jgi:predicted pyridoxine 5'-phosphate oxidase superfamily flavin-nucleotide-binding protein
MSVVSSVIGARYNRFDPDRSVRIEKGGSGMGVLTEDMRRVVEEQRLGFIATVRPDGGPNLSPKGSTTVWDDDHLVFADFSSPDTIANLRRNPAIEINVVDVTLRKGYRFRGVATVLGEGPQFEKAAAFYRARGTTNPIKHIVLVKVERAAPLWSPAYDLGQSEADVIGRWERHWDDLRRRRAGRS